MQKDSDSENVPQKRFISKDQSQSNIHSEYAFPSMFNYRTSKTMAPIELESKKPTPENSSNSEVNGQYNWTNNTSDVPKRFQQQNPNSIVLQKGSTVSADMESVDRQKPINSRTFARYVQDDAYRGPGPSSSSNANRNKKITPFMMLLSEDMRISKILRRLLDENTSASALELCAKLETAVKNQSNTQYICRSFDTLAEQIIIILKQAPIPCLRQMATIFGLMGYINRADFPVYKNYIMKNYATSRSIQKYLMLSLKTTFSCDAVNKDLNIYSERMLVILKEYLENADLVDNFMAVSDTIVEFSKHYKRPFEKHFTDIVDIVVGWHLETEQSQSLKHYCSTVLQSLSEYFVRKLDFTFGLLGQFLEDIQSACEDINSLNKSPLASPELSVGAFVGAFNSIMKSLATPKEFIAFTVGRNLVKTAVNVITKAAKQSLINSSCGETVYSVNEFFTLIFSNYNKIEDIMLIEDIEEIIQIEISNMDKFDVTLVGSLLILVLTIINQLKANTPIHLISTLLKMDGNFLNRTKFSQDDQNFKLLVKIYHEILMIKNVPLLLEAYRHILLDIELSIDSINPENDVPPVYTSAQAECVLSFYFSALANLATQTSSIIGMYALNPSILELLITNCQSTNMNIWYFNPTLHTALISLLSAHCQKNHNYRMSSRLLCDNFFAKLTLDESSPTSENFSRILLFLAEILAHAGHVSKITLKIILNWVNNLLGECRENEHILKDHKPFIDICDSLCTTSLLLPMECAKCIRTLQTYEFLEAGTLMLIRGASLSHLQSTDARVRGVYCDVLGRLPLNVSLLNPSEELGIFMIKNVKTSELQHWYISTALTASLRELYFPDFIDKVSISSNCNTIDGFLKDIFPKCWIAELREKAADYYRTTLGNQNMLTSWIQWEAARYCVKNKLRTKLGKPQSTFLKIESIVMQYARVLALKDADRVKSDDELIANEKHARILLGFLECLEKCIYNAAEGTAFAIQAPEKPAKTFFRVNTPTCKEWFNRIRTAVNLIAIHCMEPQMVVRYSETMLRSLVVSGKTNDMIFDHTVMSLVWALLKCKEPDSLQGLYVWIKLKTGKRYQWIKYASEHAAGHRELAADGYATMIASEEKIDSHVREFLWDQMFDCLYFTNQWGKLRSHLDSQQSERRDTLPVFGMSSNQLEVMENLYHDYNADISVLELSKWENVETKPKELPSNFSCYKILSSLRSTLTASTLSGNISDLAVCSKLIKAGLEESIQKRYSEHFHDFTILNHVACKLLDKNDSCDTFDAYVATEDSATLTKCVNWAQFFARRQGSDIKHSMYLNVASVARKDGNYRLCRSELERFFQVKGVGKNIDELFTSVLKNEIRLDISDTEILQGFSEMSKCMYTNPERQSDAVALASACCLQVIEQVSTQKASQYPETVSRMLLTLSEWLPQQFSLDEFLLDQKNENKSQQHLRNLLISVPDISGHPHEDFNEIIPPIDMAVGKLIQTSVLQCDHSGRSWSAFGNWCYRWGKKLVEAKTEDNCDKAGLSQRDIELIKEFIVANITDDDVAAIVQVLDKHQVTATEDEDIETNEISSTELIENQLRKIPVLTEKPVNVIMSIIKIWRQAHKSVYVYYEMAAEAYFKYLSLSSSNNPKSGDCSLVTATLRLLRLVVKHAFGLQEVLEDGLSYTPTRPWKVIVPQLFSRLNHHEPYVRKRVSELLCRVAEDTPHLIIFPAVVGAFQEHKQDESTSIDELNPLTYCFNSLLTTLSNQASETVQQVQLLVRELKRVTLLWDEFWIHSLTQLYNEYSHLFNALELEAKKSSAMQNYSNLNAKHTILMTHIAEDLKKLFAVTSKPAETNYERSFQEKYSSIIENTIDELNKPLNLAKVNESWQKLKLLYTAFQQRLQKNSQSSLKMVDISPVLANMKNTAISMPGVETTENEPIFIKAVDNTVYILPTKTKPKKLAFFGSNGKRYTYLFKGLEDLHLDERIMQFLSISNSMMARTNSNIYRAHHYSVIPLGPQSGLISWVDGVTPLFGIYKKWQQREAASKDRQGTVLTRPSEMFYGKLSPLLAEKNIKVTDSRKTWPLTILRQVLDELSKETPRDLLAKELWCHSDNCATWRASIRKYSLSVAVMSVIGYVIGLGDRHLDNVLVKLSTGEIVHIDYNVCFEKGKTLRVPEKVPFRMTPNLEEALGVTGIEGAFRIGCEHVLKTLRKERETLLTLLEAFVYDPLVDWAVGDDGTTTTTRSTSALSAAAKIAAIKATSAANNADDSKKKKKPDDNKKSETEVTRNTILARFIEIKPYWTQYRDEVISKLQQVLNSLTDLEANRQSIHQTEMERDALTKQLAMIRELETLGSAMGSHALNTISQRYNAYKKSSDDFASVKATITAYQKDLRRSTTLYFHTLLGGSGIGELNSLRRVIQCTTPSNEFDIVKDLLENSAQNVLYGKSDFARKEMDNTLQQQGKAAFICTDAINQYVQVMRFYPHSKLRKSRLVKYEGWYRNLLEGHKEPGHLKDELHTLANGERVLRSSPVFVDLVVGYATKLEQMWIEANFTLRTFNIPNEENVVADQQDTLNENRNRFLNTGVGSLHALRFATLKHIVQSNGEMFLFETSTTDALDYQINYIQYLLSSQYIFELSSNVLDILESLETAFLAIRSFRFASNCKIPSIIIELFMMNDDEDLFKLIEKAAGKQVACFKNEMSSFKNDSLDLVLNEIEHCFSSCQKTLNAATKCLRSATNWEQFLQTQKNSNFQQVISVLLNPGQDFFEQNKMFALSQVFSIAKQQAESVCNSHLDNPYDIRSIGQPIRTFIIGLQEKLINGLTSLAGTLVIDDLNSRYRQDFSDMYSLESHIHTAKDLAESMFVCHQRKCGLQLMQLQLDQQLELVDHLTLISSAHFWANEGNLRAHAPPYGHIISKEKLLSSMQSSSQSLSVWKITMEKIQAEIDENTCAIIPRLKWAAGANPNMVSVKEQFEEMSSIQMEKFRAHTSLSNTLMEFTAVIVQFELLQGNTQNQAKMDSVFLSVVSQYEEMCSAEKRVAAVITPTERSIVQLLDPEGTIDQCWINNISGLLDEMTYGVHKKIVDLEKCAQNIQEDVFCCSSDLQSLMDTQLRVDIRHLLKMFSKVDTESQSTGRVREFQNIYRQFFAQLNDLNMKILCRDFAEANVRQMFEQANDLIRDVEQNHTDLIDLVEDFHADSMDRRNVGGPIVNDPKKGNQREQKRNAYAVSVWKRIRMKLEGRDPDPNRRCTISEQVDYMIREATNPDNLAVLYEGWTPWV